MYICLKNRSAHLLIGGPGQIIFLRMGSRVEMLENHCSSCRSYPVPPFFLLKEYISTPVLEREGNIFAIHQHLICLVLGMGRSGEGSLHEHIDVLLGG